MPIRLGRSRRAAPNGHVPVRSFLKDRAYEQIKHRLLNNDYAPGMFLSERQLAENLGMSKTPVKAALERLELEGFIAVSPQQGIIVRELSVHETADLYEIWLALESYTPAWLVLTRSDRESPRQPSGGAALRNTGE